MGLLTREAILAAQDLGGEDVAVPEWGGTVRVRTMTGTERDQFETVVMQAKGATPGTAVNIRAWLAALTVCDADGTALFTVADVEALGRKSAAALERVFAAASRLNALTDRDVAELGKDSAATPSASSTSASPSD